MGEVEAFEVLPENWVVVELLEALETQWEYRPDGQRKGYNYIAADIVIKRRFSKEDKNELFTKLQLCEKEILKAWYPDNS